uniref:Uncharacterized protein n=1 Tax=uncultured bacterium Contig575 TaxID=1393592 RepID=W0FHZ5_9BACT|nr:hypothetical protein [uncultured bacterium Contig575]
MGTLPAGDAPGGHRDSCGGEGEITMATKEELVKQYETDPELQREVDEILADGRITIREFMSFAKRHNVNVSLKDLPSIIAEAKKSGLVK